VAIPFLFSKAPQFCLYLSLVEGAMANLEKPQQFFSNILLFPTISLLASQT
jgi:hypothetical protein